MIMKIQLEKVTITLEKTEEEDDIYNLWDILSFYKDYCTEHPERTDAISLGKKELANKLINVLKINI